jgi:hypothetical protein
VDELDELLLNHFTLASDKLGSHFRALACLEINAAVPLYRLEKK